MVIRQVDKDKKRYLELLLLADEQEDMIDRYLEHGTLFVLEDDGVKGVCVVTQEGEDLLEIKNLATAGRCISTTDEMWEYSRVIPVCAVSGEAAGTAAALGKNFPEVDITALQNKLKENGVLLHWDERKV